MKNATNKLTEQMADDLRRHGVAADPDVLARSGGVFTTPRLAEEYGFTDVDGTRESAFWREHWGTASG